MGMKNLGDRLLWAILMASAFAVGACSDNAALEKSLAPDPSLQDTLDTAPAPEPVPGDRSLPPEIPIYDQAQLLNRQPQGDREELLFAAAASPAEIRGFYREIFQGDRWQLTTDGEQLLEATGPTLTLAVNLAPSNRPTDNGAQLFVVTYGPKDNPPEATEVKAPPEPVAPTPGDRIETFSDWEDTPESLQPYLTDLWPLGVIDPVNGRLKPNDIITRREFLKLLVQVNNLFYPVGNYRHVRLQTENLSAIAFADLTKSDPDFALIQSVAETGLIDSRLTNENQQFFKPNDPLTRGDLLAWKITFDARGTTLKADDAAPLRFQDLDEIPGPLQPYLQFDLAQENQATLYRSFGYTQLLQPNKPVTRAEAIAALWSFGQGDNRITPDRNPQD